MNVNNTFPIYKHVNWISPNRQGLWALVKLRIKCQDWLEVEIEVMIVKHFMNYITQVVFEGRKAVGVVFKHEGKQKLVHANNEVILSAGTVGTAKLLLLSGVGPRNHLQAVKVSSGIMGFLVSFVLNNLQR